MKLLQIAPYKFINIDQIVSVEYTPSSEEEITEKDGDVSRRKQMLTPSSIYITFSNGENISEAGRQADDLFEALKPLDSGTK
jgi:hypothetical protein